jgi:hypothetical protein
LRACGLPIANKRAARRRHARPNSRKNLFVRVATIIGLPHRTFLGNGANRRNAAYRPKTRRPDLNINPVLESDRVARDAINQRRKTRNISENALEKVVRLARLQGARRHDRQHATLARTQNFSVVDAATFNNNNNLDSTFIGKVAKINMAKMAKMAKMALIGSLATLVLTARPTKTTP